MKKLLSAVLCAAMAFTVSACGRAAQTGTAQTALPKDESQYQLTAADVPTPVNGGSATIAVVVSSDGVEEDGYNAAVWQGVRTFCLNFNFMPQSYTLEEDTAAGAEAMLRQAAESGASMIVCAGPIFESAVYAVQNNYPTVSYLLLDGEPHSVDYTAYQTAAATHCVLFREEQAGFLAGYAAVMEGYADIGFLGANAMPPAMRYGTGYLQGAEAAAEKKGVQVNVKYWLAGTEFANEDITTRMSGWYADGCQVIFAAGGTLAQSCADAAKDTGGHVIAADHDQSALGTMVLSTAQKCLSRIAQQQLYKFYAGGGTWGAADAGKTETLGISADALALPTDQWAFVSFSQEDYAAIYTALHDGTTKVERCADLAGMPDTPNLTIDYQNVGLAPK